VANSRKLSPNFANSIGEDFIYRIEVAFQESEFAPLRDFRCGNTENQIDVSVDPEQQMLQYQRSSPVGALEREQPGAGRLVPCSILLERFQVSISEDHIESFHPTAVLELPIRDAIADDCCDTLYKVAK
jgi:hypothetical protein